MKKSVLSLVVSLGLGAILNAGAGCTEVPNRKVLPQGFHADASVGNGGESSGDSGSGGKGGSSGSGTGGEHEGGVAGMGGQGGSGGGAVDGGDGGGLLFCANSPCKDFTGFGTNLTACCAGETGQYCGLDTTPIGGPGCLELNQPGSPDATCPDLTQDGVLHKGCCLDRSSTCGLQFAVPGGPSFGCADLVPFGGTPQSCTPTCSATKGPCTVDSDCCDASPKVVACVNAGGTGVCSYYCTKNSECTSGCCAILEANARGVCAPDASYCPTGCGNADDVCETDADCCTGNVCVSTDAPGPKLCRPSCNTSQDCAPEQCLPDATTSKLACARAGATLCSDTCRYANDNECDDGGPGSTSSACALGSDCTDCAKVAQISARLGGTRECSDSCGTAHDNICQDGGPGSTAYTCSFGTDCADCGPRRGICTDSCTYARDGSCDDGSANAAYADCAPGTDCSDCGVFEGGRGDSACDGSLGSVCVPRGSQWSSGGGADGACSCGDCAWDAKDCGVSQGFYCDGASISSTCSTSNPNGAGADGICQCGGWCDWEKADCGAVGPAKCDGLSISSACALSDPYSYANDGTCDCNGACSWDAQDCALSGTISLCDDTCTYAGDGSCDDDFYCTYGTDCADCGPRPVIP
ncbi:MAG TPA: hypothetical protein VHE30_28405 [Polyangiaceae bacterium]|nr:hypothetical protein [Polyangiaceae bacterium]